MTYQALDTVVLVRDLPEHRLRRGDLGAVVEVHEGEGLEVEFMLATGGEAAVLTLTTHDVRRAAADELLAVRIRRPA